MRIQQIPYYPSSHSVDTADKNMTPENITDMKKTLIDESAVDITISEEGKHALKERGKGVVTKFDYTDISKLEVQYTNEVAWEHYTAMREFSSVVLKDGKYNVKDVMKSMMEAYEARYHEIVEAHKMGERQVSYELTGKRALTLEEDLAGLEEAFNMRLANLEGYITCQQTNKAFANPDSSWYFERNNIQNKVMDQENYHYFDEEYRNTAVLMMKQAREEFLVLFNHAGYSKGAAIRIISGLLNENTDFLEKTQKLFG